MMKPAGGAAPQKPCPRCAGKGKVYGKDKQPAACGGCGGTGKSPAGYATK